VDTDGAAPGPGGYPAGRSTVTTSGTVNVADAPLTDAGVAITYSALEGNPLRNVVITMFSDADPNAVPADYTVSVDWGDGTTSAGQVQVGVEVFNVFGTHTFAEEGSYHVKVTVNDTDGTATVGSTLTVTTTTVNVIDAPLVPVNSPITVPAI